MNGPPQASYAHKVGDHTAVLGLVDLVIDAAGQGVTITVPVGTTTAPLCLQFTLDRAQLGALMDELVDALIKS